MHAQQFANALIKFLIETFEFFFASIALSGQSLNFVAAAVAFANDALKFCATSVSFARCVLQICFELCYPSISLVQVHLECALAKYAMLTIAFQIIAKRKCLVTSNRRYVLLCSHLTKFAFCALCTISAPVGIRGKLLSNGGKNFDQITLFVIANVHADVVG